MSDLIASTLPRYAEIKEYILDNVDDYEGVDDWEELHNELFNVGYYLIGTYECKEWIGGDWFTILTTIKEWEEDTFGEMQSIEGYFDLEKIVNLYVYIVGHIILYDYLTPHTDKYDTTRENVE